MFLPRRENYKNLNEYLEALCIYNEYVETEKDLIENDNKD